MCWQFLNYLLSRTDAGKERSRKKSEVKEIELKQMSSEEEEIKALFELFDNDGDR